MADADEKPTPTNPTAHTEHVPDLGEWIEDTVTLSGDPKRLVAKKTVNAYTKAAFAAAALPLALGPVAPGQTAISQAQQPVKRPEEHQPSQSQQPNNTVGGMGFLIVAASTANHDFSIVEADGTKVYFTVPTMPKKD